MEIKEVKKETKATKDFAEKKWAIADLEHYGENVKWEKTTHDIVARDSDNKIIGKLDSSMEAGVAHISNIMVAKSGRRQGIGKALMLRAEEFARKNGAHKIFLKTGKGWGSVSFYESLGYKITGEFLDHSFHQDFVIFTKFLK